MLFHHLIATESMIAMRSAPMLGRMAMSSITIRNLAPGLKERLRIRAAEQGHSMEAEARRILQTALTTQSPAGTLYARVRARFEPLGGVELDLPPRESA